MRPDPSTLTSDPEYIRGLLERAGMSQRAAARAIGVNERTMRAWLAGQYPWPYTAQYALERLAS
jgi:transcriptional regulator with XRE-family HTH domain